MRHRADRPRRSTELLGDDADVDGIEGHRRLARMQSGRLGRSGRLGQSGRLG
jgi:hypothetical protein